jgi:hypothetical protein
LRCAGAAREARFDAPSTNGIRAQRTLKPVILTVIPARRFTTAELVTLEPSDLIH